MADGRRSEKPSSVRQAGRKKSPGSSFPYQASWKIRESVESIRAYMGIMIAMLLGLELG